MTDEHPPSEPAPEPRRGLSIAAVVAGAALLLGIGGTVVALLVPSAPSASGSVSGITVPALSTEESIELSSFAGRPLVVNFWASWCIPCIEEMPDFQDVYASVRDEVAFLGIAVKDHPDDARKLARQTGVRYPLGTDSTGELFVDLDGVGMPTTLFVDAQGEIVERFTGPLDQDALRKRLERHFDV